jgi:general secretion pathway protein D
LATSGGCSLSLKKNLDLGRVALQKKDWDNAVAHFLEAVNAEPRNVEARIALGNALVSASNSHLKKGAEHRETGRLNAALVEFEKALEFNPENNRARQYKLAILKHLKDREKKRREKAELEKRKKQSQKSPPDVPRIDYKKRPYSFMLSRTQVKEIFKIFSKVSGINFIFDEAFKSKRIDLDVKEVDFMGALETIVLQSRLFYKVIDERTILIIPDTPSNRKKHEELIMKTLFLTNAKPENLDKMIKTLVGIKTIVVDKDLNALTIKGTPGKVKMAEKLVQIHDKPKGELFIDIEIIEVNRSRANEYGIELSQYQVTETYSPAGEAETQASTIRANLLPHTDTSDYLLSLPSIHYKLLRSDRDSRIKARPQLRVLDGQKIKVGLGDKVPIPTTSFVPYNTAGPAQQPITSYQQQDVGINIELTPQIHPNGLVTLEMKFELTFITSPGTERLPPTIGNRSVETVIKLRDSETSMLAGLLRDTERKTMRGFPLISSIPLLKEIFSGNKKEIEQTDIILTLTPRIVRFPEILDEDQDYLWVGTETNPGLKAPPAGLAQDQEEDEKKDTAAETQKTSPKTVPVNPLTISLDPADASKTGGSLEKGVETRLAFMLHGDPKKTRRIKAVTVEMNFDRTVLEVLAIAKGSLVTAQVTGNLLKNIDNAKGNFKFTISFAQPVTIAGTQELATISVKPLSSGTTEIRPVNCRILDQDMKPVVSLCPATGIKIIE